MTIPLTILLIIIDVGQRIKVTAPEPVGRRDSLHFIVSSEMEGKFPDGCAASKHNSGEYPGIEFGIFFRV
jgi:hypothetical protein